jgi:hypothetical protein
MRSMLWVETVFGALVLAGGVTWVLMRRRRVGRATWAALGGLTLLVVAMLAGQLWELYALGLLDARDTVGWEVVNRWDDLVRMTFGLTVVAGVLALTWSVFVGRPTQDGS